MENARSLVIMWRSSLMKLSGPSVNARVVGFALAEFASPNGRECFPSQKTIAAAAGCSVRSVQRATQELETEGWIVATLKPRKGGEVRGQAWHTSYELTLPEEYASVSPSNTEEHASVSPSSGKSTPICREEHANLSPYLVKKTKNVNNAHFEETWKLYPRKVGKKAALRAWTATIRRGIEPETLHCAVSRYVAVCRSDETPKKFIKHPATFFGPDEPWQDYTDEALAEQREKPYGGRLQ